MIIQRAAGRLVIRGVLLIGLQLVGWASLAAAEPIEVSGAVAGRTPGVLGYNSGHFLPGSNTAAWWKYSGVNGSRIFSNLRQLTPASSFSSQTDATLDATTQTAFEAQRAALRAKGPLSTYVDWQSIHLEYFGETLPGSNAIQPNHAQAAMATLARGGLRQLGGRLAGSLARLAAVVCPCLRACPLQRRRRVSVLQRARPLFQFLRHAFAGAAR